MEYFEFRPFTPRLKRDVVKFFRSLSKESRLLLSTDGIDVDFLYTCFSRDWKKSYPVCLYIGKTIVAVGKLERLSQTDMYISSVAVHEAFRRRGLGTRVVRYLIALAFLHSAQRVYAHVKKENTASRQLFEKLGFRAVGEANGLIHYVKVLDSDKT